jgi:sugar phosphate isomerase/epimerase
MSIFRNAITRRDFVRTSAAAVAGTMLTGLTGCRSSIASPAVPVGVQLYSVRHELAADLPGTFERLAAIGFEGVEYADYFGRSAAELRTQMDRNGLRACGTHIHIADLQGQSLSETIEFNQELGNEFLIVRWIGEEHRTDRDAFLRLMDTFNDISEQVGRHGMRAGYHAHAYIFDTFDGETLWDIMAANTRPEFVMQLDTGWALEAGEDPAELIRRWPGRTRTMHVKAYEPGNPAVVMGEDSTDWAAIVRAAGEVGEIEWYILEYEDEHPLEALDRSMQYFRRITSV